MSLEAFCYPTIFALESLSMRRKPNLLLLAATIGISHGQNVTHRWSFNDSGSASNGTVVPDLINSAPGTIVGNGATLNGTSLTLPGGSNGQVATSSIAAYFNLPNGIISSKTDLTIEIWATIRSNRNWQRLFDFGRMNIEGNGSGEISNTSGNPGNTNAQDNLMLAVQRGGALNDKQLTGRLNGEGQISAQNSISTSLNTQYHYVATFSSNTDPSTGGRFTWYRNGTQIGFIDTDFPLSEIKDVNNWLGRSQWSPDENSNISYNDVRIYDDILTPAQISSNTANGPDAAFPAPTTLPDTATLLPGQKARIPVLANDSGEISYDSLTITQPPIYGTVSISSDGSILYTHTAANTADDSFQYSVANTNGQSSTATVSITLSSSLKIPNPDLNVPSQPPATAYSLPNALGSLTFNVPICLRTPPGETQRLFVCEKGGTIDLVPDVTAENPTSSLFLNLASIVNSRSDEQIDTGGESGLLSMAFHPDYATNRLFFVFYTVGIDGLRYQRVSQFTTQSENPNLADPTSEIVFIEQRDQANNHNGGDLHFGPSDGYLYISVGDEGEANDTRLNSQLINKDLFSGILRIDVDKLPGNVAPTAHSSIKLDDDNLPRFSIPVDNPYVNIGGGTWDGTYNGSVVSGTVRREFWATGLRNPWRMSFDPATEKLWCADVGQDDWEEIDIITRGGNYGWVYREGNHLGKRTTNPPIPANFDELYHEEPVYEYPRGGNFGGYSVTGGVVYRGTRIASLYGKYIFADYGSGNVWAMDSENYQIERIAGEGGIIAFGYDPSNQDVLLADNSGIVRRLVATTATGNFPATLSETGLFADLSDLSPSPGVTPYSVNLPFWSDHAIKSRWFVIPDGTSSFTTSENDSWSLPSGTIWVKHFDLEMERGNPASKRRIETRLIVKNNSGSYGVSYRWNEDQSEAFLAEDSGEDFILNITDNGSPAPQTWRIPSRAECLICHTSQAGHALSFNTRQLNLQSSILGYSGNQLDTLETHGFFANSLGSPNLLPRHIRPDETSYSTEARVRSYIAVNCSYCHKDGATAPASWDGRPELLLEQTGLINGDPNSNGGDAANKLIVPGDAAHSIVLSRVAETNGFSRMPPIGSNVIDETSVSLLTDWINGELTNRMTYDEWRSSEFDPANDPSGARDQDPDQDGLNNEQEFLAGTDPHDGSSAFRPEINSAPLSLGFELPANSSFRIDVSSDLDQWDPWDIPGNQGLPVAGGLIEFALPSIDPTQFFRVELIEN